MTWTNDDNFTHTVQVDGQDDHKVGRGDSVSIRSTSPAPTTTSARCTARTWTGGDRRVTLAELRRDVVIVACAVSAGIHGALAPEHFGEGTGAGSASSRDRPARARSPSC